MEGKYTTLYLSHSKQQSNYLELNPAQNLLNKQALHFLIPKNQNFWIDQLPDSDLISIILSENGDVYIRNLTYLSFMATSIHSRFISQSFDPNEIKQYSEIGNLRLYMFPQFADLGYIEVVQTPQSNLQITILKIESTYPETSQNLNSNSNLSSSGTHSVVNTLELEELIESMSSFSNLNESVSEEREMEEDKSKGIGGGNEGAGMYEFQNMEIDLNVKEESKSKSIVRINSSNINKSFNSQKVINKISLSQSQPQSQCYKQSQSPFQFQTQSSIFQKPGDNSIDLNQVPMEDEEEKLIASTIKVKTQAMKKNKKVILDSDDSELEDAESGFSHNSNKENRVKINYSNSKAKRSFFSLRKNSHFSSSQTHSQNKVENNLNLREQLTTGKKKRQSNNGRKRRLRKGFEKIGQNFRKLEEAKEDYKCCICINEIEEVGKLPCEHLFCMDCIQTWANVTNLCPLCKKEFDKIIHMKGGYIVKVQNVEAKRQRVPSFDDELDDDDERDFEDGICYVCNEDVDSGLLLICDRCQDQFCHTYCDDLEDIPTGEWTCLFCRMGISDEISDEDSSHADERDEWDPPSQFGDRYRHQHLFGRPANRFYYD